MANRRMFSKSVVQSSQFLRMPATSRLLYYDLGMAADDDGFVEWYSVVRMSGATEQDLQVIQANNFIHIFDDRALVIIDWKENNYIQRDRYTASRLAKSLGFDVSQVENGKYTQCIHDVSKMYPQVRLGEVREDKVNTVTNVTESKALKEYGNPEVNEVLKVWEDTYQGKPDGAVKANRQAASTLVKRHGLEKVCSMIKYAASIQGERYAPTITSLVHLRDKSLQLAAFFKKNDTPNMVIV